MKPRRRPEPLRYMPHPLLYRSKRFRDAVEAIANGTRWRETLTRFNPEERLHLLMYAVKKRYPSIDGHAYARKLFDYANELAPTAVAPKIDTPIADSITGWSTDIGQELWSSWWDPTVRRADTASMEASKLVGLVTAAGRYGPHILAGHDLVAASAGLREAFTRLTVGSGRLPEAGALRVPGYEQTTKNLRRIAPLAIFPSMVACVRSVQEMARLHPGATIGRYLVVDGSLIPAWAPQRSAKRDGVLDLDIEARYRARSPEAGYRVQSYKPPAEVGRRERAARVKAVRGYLLVVVSDMATGIPLVGVLEDASKLHEAHAVRRLLEALFAIWPDCPAEFLVGDAGWDENAAQEYALTHYGISIISHRRPSHAKDGGIKLEGDRFHPQVARVTGDGQAICRAHGALLPFSGAVVPTRAGLSPGKPASPAGFRSRWTCTGGCGRVSVATRYAWSAMPVLPLNPVGRPGLHAKRMVLLGRRNVAETVFSSLKCGYGQGTAGPYRTRVLDREQVEGFIWLSFVTRALMMLASERRGGVDEPA
jgi:hypothetical protein